MRMLACHPAARWGSEYVEVYRKENLKNKGNTAGTTRSSTINEDTSTSSDEQGTRLRLGAGGDPNAKSITRTTTTTTRLDLTLSAERDQLGVPAALEPLARWMLQRRVKWGFSGLVKHHTAARAAGDEPRESSRII